MNDSERDELLVRVDERVLSLTQEVPAIASRVSTLETLKNRFLGGVGVVGVLFTLYQVLR